MDFAAPDAAPHVNACGQIRLRPRNARNKTARPVLPPAPSADVAAVRLRGLVGIGAQFACWNRGFVAREHPGHFGGIFFTIPEKQATVCSLLHDFAAHEDQTARLTHDFDHGIERTIRVCPQPTNWVDNSSVTDGPAFPLPSVCMAVNSDMSISDSVTAP